MWMKSEVWEVEWSWQNGNHIPCLEGVSAIQQVIVVQLKSPTKVRNLCSCIHCLIFRILVHTPNATMDQL